MASQTQDRRTRHVRLAEDLVEKLGWINALEGASANDVVDPLIRPEVERRFGLISDRVEVIKAAKAGHFHDLGEAGA